MAVLFLAMIFGKNSSLESSTFYSSMISLSNPCFVFSMAPELEILQRMTNDILIKIKQQTKIHD